MGTRIYLLEYSRMPKPIEIVGKYKKRNPARSLSSIR